MLFLTPDFRSSIAINTNSSHWVAYQLTKEKTAKAVERGSSFRPDLRSVPEQLITMTIKAAVR